MRIPLSEERASTSPRSENGSSVPCSVCGEIHQKGATHDFSLQSVLVYWLPISYLLVTWLVTLLSFVSGIGGFFALVARVLYSAAEGFIMGSVALVILLPMAAGMVGFQNCPRNGTVSFTLWTSLNRLPDVWKEALHKLASWIDQLSRSPLFKILSRCTRTIALFVLASVAASNLDNPVFLTVVIAGVGWLFFTHNRRTFPKRICVPSLFRAARRTLAIGTALFILLIPALAVKGYIDYQIYRAIDTADARMAGHRNLTVPSVVKDEYPWYSPLWWAGIPRVQVVQKEASIEGPVTQGRLGLQAAKWGLQAFGIASNFLLLVLFARALATILCRQLIARGIGLTFYAPQFFGTATESPEPREYHLDAISSRLDLSSESTRGEFVFLRPDLSPSGDAPEVVVPQSEKALYARLRAGNFIMHKYTLSANPVTVLASEGHRFAQMELKAGDEVVFSYRNLIGWTDSIVVETNLSLQLGGLALGRWFVHRATGPGTLFFDVSGEAEILTGRTSTPFEIERLLAFDKAGIFTPDAKPGWLDTIMGVLTIRNLGEGRCLLDSRGDGHSRSRPILGPLIRAYSLR